MGHICPNQGGTADLCPPLSQLAQGRFLFAKGGYKMNADELRRTFLDFYHERGHALIGSAPLVPQNDPSVLFTTAGMHPLVPYLLGESHPAGVRLANYQKCLR